MIITNKNNLRKSSKLNFVKTKLLDASHDTTPAASEGTENGVQAEKTVTQTVTTENNAKKPSTKKRNSILTLLLHNNNRNSIKTETSKNGKSSMSYHFEEEISHDESTMPSIQEQSEPFPETIPLKNIHRKRSISTPNLQALGIENLSSLNATKNDSKTNYPSHLQRYLEDDQEKNEKFHRTMSLKTTRRPRTRTQSDTAQSTSSRQSLRIKRSRFDKPSTSTLPHTNDENYQETGMQQDSIKKKNQQKSRSLKR